VLVAAAAVLAFLPRAGTSIDSAVLRFQDYRGYAAAVLLGARQGSPAVSAAAAAITPADVLTGAGSAAGAVLLALAALYWRRLPLLRRGFEPGTGLVAVIQRFQSGVINDYVTWIVVGLACIGGALAFAIR
jgi:hypothetical protein